MKLTLAPLVFVALILAGCAGTGRAPDPEPPPPIAEEIWWQVESDIAAAAQAATGPATAFAQRRMEVWRDRVIERAESEFIPWASSYWAQQWMTAKVAWYKLTASEGGETPENRLAVYLQEQYHEQVLAPVALEVDPGAVIAQATRLYLHALEGELQAIPARYGVPPDQFRKRLQRIPAIVPASPKTPGASLQQLLAADPVERQPAYAALIQHVRESNGVAEAGLTKKRISPVAVQVSEKLVARLAISGGTSAVSALIGGVAGNVFSLGAAGLGMILHEPGRVEVEVELRVILDESMEEVWALLMGEPGSGVTAGVYRLANQIRLSLQPSSLGTVLLTPLPLEIPLTELAPVAAPLPVAGPEATPPR
ncbi:MAG TPA: hypothetical protein VF096_06200 [Azonexus sp.]